MGSELLPLRTSGIYKSLPTFPPSLTNLTAIITGANGISGFHTMRALLDAPNNRWGKIYAISRRPPPPEMMALLTAEQKAKVKHVASDFLKEGKEIAEVMKEAGVDKVDYVFFYSYAQPRPPPDAAPWSNAQELCDVNTALLRNFLDALDILKLKPKRFLLQTGAKNYGVHLGRSRTPCTETDPQPSHLSPNFYYPQESILFTWCDQNSIPWSIIMPAWIIGSTTNAAMNALLPFSFYAAVASQRSQPLIFPSNFPAWQAEQHHSSARLTGYLSEWVVLEEKTANQRFNSQDGSPVSMDRFFEALAKWFGVAKGVTPPPDDDSKMGTLLVPGGKSSPLGYGPPIPLKSAFTMTSWAAEPENQTAWKEIMKNNETGKGLTQDPFEDIQGNFTFGDGAFISFGSLTMGKARGLGWTGFVDTLESVREMYREMEGWGLCRRWLEPETVVSGVEISRASDRWRVPNEDH